MLFVKVAGQSGQELLLRLAIEEIKLALERDNFMTADAAKSFGLIDEVVEKRS